MTMKSPGDFKSLDHAFHEELSFLKGHGFDYVSLGVIGNDGPVASYFSHNDWGKLYSQESFFSRDPCVKGLYFTPHIMLPWVCLPNNDVMNARRHSCRITDGFSLYARIQSGYKLIIGVGSSQESTIKKFLDKGENYEALMKIRESFLLSALKM